MDLQHRMVRQAIDIALDKAMNDMQSDAKRSLRNLIDLGLYFSKGERQKSFFHAVQEVVYHPENTYHMLVTRLLGDVDHNTIKKAGLNLGYSSLMYGAQKQRSHRELSNKPLPWLLILDMRSSDTQDFNQMKRFVSEGRELGIYSYIIHPRDSNNLTAVSTIAKEYDECIFMLNISPNLISKETAAVLGATNNIVVSVNIVGMGLRGINDSTAFLLLKQNRCLYGFNIIYNDDNLKLLIDPKDVCAAMHLGNAFGLYVPADSASDRCQEAVYKFVREQRGMDGQPIILLEWLRDMDYINQSILSGGWLKINLPQIAYGEYTKARNVLTNSLLDTLNGLKGLQPCVDV